MTPLPALLQQYPSDLPVVVPSYEAGYDSVTDVTVLPVAETPDRTWYVGVYEDIHEVGEKVVLLSSKYHQTDVDAAETSA